MAWQCRARQLLTFMALTAVFAAGLSFTPMRWVDAQGPVRTRAGKVCQPLARSEIVKLPFAARDVALHWAGNPEAQVRVAFSTDGKAFGDFEDAGRDEVGEQVGDGRTYGSILSAQGATAVRVEADRGIGNLCVLALADEEQNLRQRRVPAGTAAGAAVARPTIQSRFAWGAEESYRFDSSGGEVWKQEYWPIQKLIVHHTATKNRDPDPKATIRSIYYYHAVEQKWGDIGYNFLIDEAGTIYKGRYSSATDVDRVDGENDQGYGVRAGHAYGFNAGTVGVALLGTLTGKSATTAARSSLERFLAWKASNPLHVLDPLGSSTYVNPVDGTTKANLPNIPGHRDVNATDCPGGAFYKALPSVRKNVAALIAASS